MKTIFKVGMEVWDKTISPNKGRVIEVFTDIKFDFPIKVEFENGMKVRYTKNGCFVKNDSVPPTLSTTDYHLELQNFEQKEPAPTYEEVVRDKNYIYLPENLVAPNKELADATNALLKLLFLRDYYNEGWQPDWDINKVKYIIKRHGNRHFSNIETSENHPSVLYFKSKEIRDKFLKEQRELLEIAKPLL